MSNKKKAKHQSKKNSVAKNIAGGAVGTIFNVVLIIVAVMLIYYFAVSAYQYGVRDLRGARQFREEPGTEINVTITDGMDFKGIAKQLYEKGLVREERLFYIQERLSNYSEDGFVAGDYVLSTAMTPDEMMDVMGAGGDDK